MSTFNRGNMQYRFLGRTGLRVSCLSLGGWVTYGDQVGGDLALQCMSEAWKHGINYFDTAEAYADGKCEIAMGKAIKKLGWKREDFVISTKLFWGGPKFTDTPNKIGLSRKHLMEGINKCLERLQLDYVDIIMAHRPDPWTPMEEIVRAFHDIVTSGKALYWGTSEFSAFEIERAQHIATKHNLTPPIADQPEYNLFARHRVEAEYEPLYEIYGYGLTTFSPLASGLLSGKYNDGIPEGSRMAIKDNPLLKWMQDQLNSEEGKAKVEKVKELGKIAQEIGGTMAQLSIAWLLKNGNVSSVITGASRPEQVTSNVKAMEILPKLTPEIMERIDKIMGNKPAPRMTWDRDV